MVTVWCVAGEACGAVFDWSVLWPSLSWGIVGAAVGPALVVVGGYVGWSRLVAWDRGRRGKYCAVR